MDPKNNRKSTGSRIEKTSAARSLTNPRNIARDRLTKPVMPGTPDRSG